MSPELKRTIELEEENRRLKEFAASVIHDLKSPAVGALGLIKLLVRQYSDQLDEKGKRYCDQVSSCLESIFRLVEDLNLFISAKEAPMHFEPLDFMNIVKILRDEFSVKLAMRSVRLIPPDQAASFTADQQGIIRILRNLIDNALKYGGDDLRFIKINCQVDPFGTATISVADDGIGIKKDSEEKVFDFFERCGQSPEIQGSGLGLAIVKEIAERHGGSVSLQTSEENGTIFRIVIPDIKS